jgi:hypothetical protein
MLSYGKIGNESRINGQLGCTADVLFGKSQVLNEMMTFAILFILFLIYFESRHLQSRHINCTSNIPLSTAVFTTFNIYFLNL